jgi:hypothetical protein
MVERAGDLRSDLIELLGVDVEIPVGFAQLLAGVLKGVRRLHGRARVSA